MAPGRVSGCYAFADLREDSPEARAVFFFYDQGKHRSFDITTHAFRVEESRFVVENGLALPFAKSLTMLDEDREALARKYAIWLRVDASSGAVVEAGSFACY